uniref:Uncharacterized protein n=1 Tax=Davidia involucrata TaxID=16924 RepID=A0A5B7C0B5_DAVIN
MWLMMWHGDDGYHGEADLLVRTLNLCASHWVSEELLSHPQYQLLSNITNRVCHQLCQFRNSKVRDTDRSNTNTDYITTIQIESDMQELVQLVLSVSSDGIHPDIKQTFLTVAKSFYYSAYCTPETIYSHIAKVLFERVI